MMRCNWQQGAKRVLVAATLLGVTVGLALPASATTLIEDFGDFWQPGGVYGVWSNTPPSAILTPGPDSYNVFTTGGWGGAWYVPPAPIDATGDTGFELDVIFNSGNQVPVIVLGIEDMDGSFINFAWYGLPTTGAMTLASATASNSWGSPIGDIDFSAIKAFHIQADGNDAGGAPTLMADIDFDNLNAVPEPATLALVALGGLAVIRRRR